MRQPACKTCQRRGYVYRKGDPTRHTCPDCKGSGDRDQKPIEQIGERKRAKMGQVRDFKVDYIAMQDKEVIVEGCLAAPCQSCWTDTPLNRAHFSHKVASGMGGANDIGGKVQSTNGTYSCACCHGFIEQDREAFEQHQASPANITNKLHVEFSAAVKERLKAWRQKWFNNPNL